MQADQARERTGEWAGRQAGRKAVVRLRRKMVLSGGMHADRWHAHRQVVALLSWQAGAKADACRQT